MNISRLFDYWTIATLFVGLPLAILALFIWPLVFVLLLLIWTIIGLWLRAEESNYRQRQLKQ